MDSIANPTLDDMGYYTFMDSMDALLMGRLTFEKVLSFGLEWPYQKPVFVLSNSMHEIPTDLIGKVFLMNGKTSTVLNRIHELGYGNIYLDGGRTIHNFLKNDQVDELIITRFPLLLGDGIPLFHKLNESLQFELVDSKVYLGQLVQSHYKRTRT